MGLQFTNILVRDFIKYMRVIPLLPRLYIDGKSVRKSVPVLPDARIPNGSVMTDGGAVFTIAILGESTMAGIGVEYHKDGFAGRLAHYMSESLNRSVNWMVHAQSGATLAEVNQRIVPNLDLNEVDLIVIGTGGNDAFSFTSLRKWNKEVRRTILQLSAKSNAPIVFAHMPPIRFFPAFTPTLQNTIGNWVDELGHHLGILVKDYDHVSYPDELISLESWRKKYKFESGVDVFFSDGVHPSALTYDVWARELSSFILEVL